MLSPDESVLIIIDAQGKLARIVNESETVINQIQKLIKGIMLMNVPIVLTNQVPEKLGSTIDEIACLLPDHEQISRTSFSISGEEAILNRLAMLDRNQIILCGFEAHICLYQSAMDLLQDGFEVYLVVDGVSSRQVTNKDVAIRNIEKAGGKLTTVEMALFQMVRDANNPVFKAVSKIIK